MNGPEKENADAASCRAIVTLLESKYNPRNVEGMARYGINTENTLGVPIPVLRQIAEETGRNHALALRLWDSGIHEARILACFIDEPEKVTSGQMDQWSRDFDSWDVCDQCCSHLFDKTGLAYQKAIQWSASGDEFVKRAGFTLMAALAVHDKKAPDEQFEQLFPLIRKEATDERNYVRKAVNWALRQIGKRNRPLNQKAVALAKEIQKLESKAARWIAADALRELTGEKVQERLGPEEK